MHRTRRLIATTAVVVLAAACGGGDDGADGGAGTDAGDGGAAACPTDALASRDSAAGAVEVTFWHAMGGADLERTLTAITDGYNTSQDRVHVTLVNQQGYEENFESYRTATAADRPAIVQLPDYYLQAMADSGTAIPAQACVESSGLDLEPLVDRAVEYYSLDGVLHAMPFNVSNPVLYYNKAAFEQAGLDPERPPTTLDELREYSQAIVDSGAARYGIALETGFDSGGGWVVEQWFARAGELYADNENGRAARATQVLFDSEYGVELFSFLRDLVADGLAVNVGENAAGTDNLFKLADATEPAAMTLYTSAGISSVLNVLAGGLVEGFGPDQLGIGPMPAPEGAGGITVGGASLWVVEDQPDEVIAGAWDYISYLVSAQVQSTWSVGTGYVPVHEGAGELPPLADTWASDARYRVAFDQLLAGEVNAATAGPVLGPLRQVRGEVAAALQAVLSGGADAATALAGAAEESDRLIADYAQRTGTG